MILFKMLSNQFNPGTKIRVSTRGKFFYERSEGTEIEVGLLKMTDLDKEIIQEIYIIEAY